MAWVGVVVLLPALFPSRLPFRPGTGRDLTLFNLLLRTKPYPLRCPYDDDPELFSTTQPLGLRPCPTRAEADALRRLYRPMTAFRPNLRALEIVADGSTRLPRSARASASTVHLSAESLEVAAQRGGDHVLLDAETLPWADGTFDTVLCHGCAPVSKQPLQLLAEACRVLRPGGRLALSWSASDRGDTDGAVTSAWAQAQDGAEQLYFACSLFHYCEGRALDAQWRRLRVQEALPGRLLAVVASKQTTRALMRQRAITDVASRRYAPPAKAPPVARADGAAALPLTPGPELPDAGADTPAAPASAKRSTLQQEAREARKSGRGSPAPVRRPRGDDRDPAESGKERVRSKARRERRELRVRPGPPQTAPPCEPRICRRCSRL